MMEIIRGRGSPSPQSSPVEGEEARCVGDQSCPQPAAFPGEYLADLIVHCNNVDVGEEFSKHTLIAIRVRREEHT